MEKKVETTKYFLKHSSNISENHSHGILNSKNFRNTTIILQHKNTRLVKPMTLVTSSIPLFRLNLTRLPTYSDSPTIQPQDSSPSVKTTRQSLLICRWTAEIARWIPTQRVYTIRIHRSWAVFVVDDIIVYFLSVFTFRYHFLPLYYHFSTCCTCYLRYTHLR